jgi:hypothetical protein
MGKWEDGTMRKKTILITSYLPSSSPCVRGKWFLVFFPVYAQLATRNKPEPVFYGGM